MKIKNENKDKDNDVIEVEGSKIEEFEDKEKRENNIKLGLLIGIPIGVFVAVVKKNLLLGSAIIIVIGVIIGSIRK